jgi:glycine oxidase
MSRGLEVIVAGAGALGLSCALALADAGCAVTVCDPALEGPSASGVAAGMLAPVFETVLDAGGGEDLDLLLAARDLWPGIEARAGIVLDRSGAIAIGPDPWLAGVQARLIGLGVPAAELGRAALEALAPVALGPALDRGLITREDWRLEPGAALKALRAAAQDAGVAFRAEAVAGPGAAAWLVVATGAGRDLAQAVPELSRLTPIKGQIVRYGDIRSRGPSLRGAQAYAVAGAQGLALGATMEPGLVDTEVDTAILAPLIEAGAALFPQLQGAAFSASAGIRATTPDGRPMVGFSASPRVLLAVGARRNGWLLAPLVGRIVAACLTGRDPGPFAGRLDPGRFY